LMRHAVHGKGVEPDVFGHGSLAEQGDGETAEIVAPSLV
jgi:hypothetical protein